MSYLIKFGIVWNIEFRNKTFYVSPVYHCGTIIKRLLRNVRESDNGGYIKIFRCFCYFD